MKCPNCNHHDTKVLESRLSHEGSSVRRRRECYECHHRYTTYEKEEGFIFQILKREKTIVPYDRVKAFTSIQIACRKRPVSMNEIEELLTSIEKEIQDSGIRTVPTSKLGDMILKALYHLDKIAYVRFASVYKDFQSPKEFLQELTSLLEKELPLEAKSTEGKGSNKSPASP